MVVICSACTGTEELYWCKSCISRYVRYTANQLKHIPCLKHMHTYLSPCGTGLHEDSWQQQHRAVYVWSAWQKEQDIPYAYTECQHVRDGTYTGTGVAEAPPLYHGFKPMLVM